MQNLHVKVFCLILFPFVYRLQGITKSMSRFPTFKRRFDDLVRSLSDDLTEIHGGPIMTRSKSAFARLISLKSFKGTRANGSAQGSQHVAKDLENSWWEYHVIYKSYVIGVISSPFWMENWGVIDNIVRVLISMYYRCKFFLYC